jgi:ABC-2 type transport system permease protein
MKSLTIFLYEWKHFIRSPFKIVALFLFIIASLYGLHNGATLYQKQRAEIEKINQKAEEQKQKIIAYYDKGEKSPPKRPWIDFTTPFWAIWNVPTYHFKMPSPAMVYSIGQAEQYGFYKQISVWASPYDADMAEEISNPERTQTGTLDYSFALLFLLPLLLLVLLYNIKSAESEQGLLPLIYVQTASQNKWLLARVLFYVALLTLINFALLLYGATLTGVLETSKNAFGLMLLYTVVYLLFWAVLYFLIIKSGKTILENSLKMVGILLLLTFIIPAAVHQWISIAKPANLMTDLIDAQREGREKRLELADSLKLKQLFSLYPQLKNTVLVNDSSKHAGLLGFSASALENHFMKEVIKSISNENSAKNNLIKATYWFNPLTFFQNQINAIAQTHYDDYENYRNEIQHLIDKRIHTMVLDIWNDLKVDKSKYLEYQVSLKSLENYGNN